MNTRVFWPAAAAAAKNVDDDNPDHRQGERPAHADAFLGLAADVRVGRGVVGGREPGIGSGGHLGDGAVHVPEQALVGRVAVG